MPVNYALELRKLSFLTEAKCAPHISNESVVFMH